MRMWHSRSNSSVSSTVIVDLDCDIAIAVEEEAELFLARGFGSFRLPGCLAVDAIDCLFAEI